MTQEQLRKLIADLEAEHRLLEQQLRCLREVAESLLESGDEQCEQELEALHRLDHFFRGEMMPHFSEEESGLFQVLRDQAPEGAALVAALEKEHASLREQFESFGGQVAALRHAGADGRAPFLSGLTRTCWETWHMLRAHADRESAAITDRLLAHLEERAAGRGSDDGAGGPKTRSVSSESDPLG